MVLSGSRTTGKVSKNSSSSRSRGASNTRKVSSSARANAQRISSLSGSGSSSGVSSNSSPHSSYNPQTGFGHTPTGFRSASQSVSSSSGSSSRSSVPTMMINGRRLDPTKPEDQRIIAQVQHQRKIRQINAQQQKLAAQMRNARNAEEAMKIREQAMAENPELGTHNQVRHDGRIVRTSGQLGVSAPEPVKVPEKRTQPSTHLGVSQEEAHSVIKSFENNVVPQKARAESFENNNIPQKSEPFEDGAVPNGTVQNDVVPNDTIPSNAKPVEQHPLGEFAKGVTSGFNDLWIVGFNIASQVQGKEPTQEPKGNALSDAIFAPIDEGLNSSSFEEYAHNLGDRYNTIGDKFNENPARELGKMFPDLLITAASVVAPPVGVARWGGQATRVASKAAQTAAKNPSQKTRPPGAKAYPKSDESKLVRNDNAIEKSDGIPIPSKPTELYGKEFVKTAQNQNKKNLVEKNTKISDDILKHGSNARTNQPHPNSRAGLNTGRTNQQTVQKPTTRQNTRPKLTQKQKDLAKEIRERFASQNVRNSQAVSKIVKPKGKTRVGTKTRAGMAGAGMAGLAVAKGKNGEKEDSGYVPSFYIPDTTPEQTPDQKTKQTPDKDNPKNDPFTTSTTFDFGFDEEQTPVTTELPPAITPPGTPFWRGFPYGGGSGGAGNPSGRGQKSYTAWAVKGVFEPVALGKSVDSLTNVENYFDAVPKRTTRKSARKTTRTKSTRGRKSNNNPFAGFWS